MNSILETVLRDLGAVFEGGSVRNFGDQARELAMVENGGYMADLSHFGLVEFSGPDATEFLHNQLSCEVKGLPADHCTLGSYCTPKGRMLASFLLWRQRDAWNMLLDRAILSAVIKRLRMFVLRSKVAIAEASESVALIGAGGPPAAAALRDTLGALPASLDEVIAFDGGGCAVSLRGDRWLVALEAQTAATHWPRLARDLTPVGTSAWDWTDIQNGVAFVSVRTQEQFVPQMTNLELIGGVSFKKGCYPGQEIVARTQHIGKVKRRLHLARVKGDAQAGDELFGEDVEGQANGMVARAAAAPGGGTDVLAVVQSASAEQSRVHWGRPDGPVLEFRPLPYAVP
jgi:folate-binding protein YgfZ